MKKYYLKQKAISFSDRYKVYDENQKIVYHCEGALFSFSHKMDLYESRSNKLIFTLKKQLFTFLPTYHITTPEGKEAATIHKRISLLKHKLDISSEYGDYTLEGDVWALHFSIMANGKTVVDFQKKWISWGDSYEIIVHDEEHTDFYIALVLMIDNCLHDGQQNTIHFN